MRLNQSPLKTNQAKEKNQSMLTTNFNQRTRNKLTKRIKRQIKQGIQMIKKLKILLKRENRLKMIKSTKTALMSKLNRMTIMRQQMSLQNK